MDHWHQKRAADIGLRSGGAALCSLSWLAFRTLFHLRLAPWPAAPGSSAFALAAIGFLCASAGAALLVLGHHMFDEIELGERWRASTVVEYRADAPTPGNRERFEPLEGALASLSSPRAQLAISETAR
jgi:hypothetical protein